MVLLPLITSQIDLPVIAAGGISDGVSMAAAFALGAEGVQMGTRMLTSAESAVHDNFKQAVVSAAETDTIMINRHNQRPLRVLRTKATEKYEFASAGDPFKELMPDVIRLYQDGDTDVGFACVGQAAGRIEAVLPVAEIIRRTVDEFGSVIARLTGSHFEGSVKTT
jgi:enoyl-[acyl-carrier protein] reductase II